MKIIQIFFTLEKHENHSKYPQNRKKILKCLKKIKGRPQKSRVGRVSGNETFFFFFDLSSFHQLRTYYTLKHCIISTCTSGNCMCYFIFSVTNIDIYILVFHNVFQVCTRSWKLQAKRKDARKLKTGQGPSVIICIGVQLAVEGMAS